MGERHEPCMEDLTCFGTILMRTERLQGERLHRCERVLYPMVQFMHQERPLFLGARPLDAEAKLARCSRGLAERNAAVPDDQRVQVRIGVNLGEVIVEGDDRFGEGVNIAAGWTTTSAARMATSRR